LREHLLTLISDVLGPCEDRSRSHGRSLSSFGLDDFLHEVSDIARVRANQSGLGFGYETLNRLPAIVSRIREKLRQILLNLLSNAVKFTAAGSVRLRAGAEQLTPTRYRLTFEIQIPASALRMRNRADLRTFHQVKQFERVIEGTDLDSPSAASWSSWWAYAHRSQRTGAGQHVQRGS